MKPFSEFITERSIFAGTSTTYKNWLIYYSKHISKKKEDTSRETRVTKEGITEKYLSERVKKAIKIIEREHLGENPIGQEYFVTYIRNDKRCGFLLMIDENPVTIIREPIPNNSKTNWTCLVKTIYPCYPKESNRPRPTSKNDTVIKLSENMNTCLFHDNIPNDIVEYMLELSEKVQDDEFTYFTVNGPERNVIFIGEDNIIDEQRVDNGFYVIDLDVETIY